MPLTLTTPMDVGDLDPGAPSSQYTTCRIKLMGNHPEVVDNPHMQVHIVYGWMDGDTFMRGKVHPSQATWPKTYGISGSDYATEVSTAAPKVALADPSDDDYIEVDVGGTPVWVERTYVASKRALYEHLIAKDIIPGGTVF